MSETFQIEKVSASNDQIQFGDDVDHTTYTVVSVVSSPYTAPTDVQCFSGAGWYGFNGNDETINTDFFLVQSCNPAFTGNVRLYFTTTAWATSTTNSKYIEYFINNGIPDTSNTTRITSITPASGEILSTSTSYTVGFTGYLNPDDFTATTRVHFHIENSNTRFTQGTGYPFLTNSNNAFSLDVYYNLDNDALSLVEYGDFEYSTTSSLGGNGKYYVTTTIQNGGYCVGQYCLTRETIFATTTTFIVSSTTRADSLVGVANDYFDTLAGSATTTAGIKSGCNIFTSFDWYDCVTNVGLLLFVPSSGFQTWFTTTLYDGILTHFPIGYITDFVSIISTTTVGTLTVFEATVPAVLPGGGSHIELNLNGILDQFLNATTGAYMTAEATSTETLFVITNRYWSYIIYVLALFYMLSRILGSHIIPIGLFKKEKIQ